MRIKEESISIHTTISIPVTITKRSGQSLSSFGEKFWIDEEEAKEKNLPICNGFRLGSELTYKIYFHGINNISADMNLDEAFNSGVQAVFEQLWSNPEVADMIKRRAELEEESKDKARLISEIKKFRGES